MNRFLSLVLIGLMGALLVILGCSTPPQPKDPVPGIVVALGKDVNLDLVLIPAGRFVMGSPASEKEHSINETQHEVTIMKPFYMGKYEVTQEQWEAVMGYNPRGTNGGLGPPEPPGSPGLWELIMGNNPYGSKGAKLPVFNVSWEDCQKFIQELNAKTNGGYRLPTEAEWEYACRAGTTTRYSFGDEITPKDASIIDYKPGKRTKLGKPVTVGSYKPNAFGLYDMHGNVREWCEDWYGDYPAGSAIDPMGPATGKDRVNRGGSFIFSVSDVRSSFRGYNSPTDDGEFNDGFRLVRMADFKFGVSPTSPKPDPVNLLLAPFTETQAKEIQKVIAKSLQKEVEEKADLGKGINLDLVLIPAGKFMMGSPESEKGQSNYVSQYEAMISKPFYMGKYEVKQDQWDAVMNSNPSNKKGVNLPVTNLSWGDSQEFIKKLNAKSSGGYRLPTEAEWEYACRAGTSTAYWVGDSLTKSDANSGDGSAGGIKVAGSYKPNAFGLYDMHGNVSEWCEDRYGVYPKGTVTDPKGPDPKGPATKEYRVLRGGSFLNNGWVASSFNRAFSSSPSRSDSVGFRLARTP